MTQRNVGAILDEMVAFAYVGVPTRTPVETLEEMADACEKAARYYRRPRLAAYTFSSLMRTPVHDLPHDGVGVVAIHDSEWRHMLRMFKRDLPSDVHPASLYGIAVEQW